MANNNSSKLRKIVPYALSVCLIIVALLIDNICELMNSEGFEHSVYYFYFNSVVFSGAFGINAAAALAVMPYFCAEFLNKANTLPSAVKTNGNTFLRYIKALVTSGLCLGLAYVCFVLILGLFFEINTQELSDGFNDFPYVKSLENGIMLFLCSVFLNAFMSGFMYASVAYLGYGLGFGYFGVLFMPIFLRQIWPIFYISFSVDKIYRLDLWLKMKTLYTNELATLGLSLLRVLMFSMFMYFIVKLLTKKIKGVRMHAWRIEKLA